MESNRPLTADEETLRKNTDCIYFLASPFTCKKGNECEFRHSEGARVNPRDCWYWMNGNCLNPKCAFRHPPLDGLFGFPGTPSGPLPAVAHASGAINPNKQSVPCYYFQKGQCLKGDMCQFMHGPHPASNHSAEQATNGPRTAVSKDPEQSTNGPNPTANHATQQAANVPTSFSGTSQTVSSGLKECTTAHQIIPKIGVDKQAEVFHLSATYADKGEGSVKGLPVKRSPSPYPLNYEPPRSQPTVAPVSSDISPSGLHYRQSQPTEEHYSNGRETDDFLGESSPGFDVLVDDEEDYGRDPDYYHNEEEYGRASVQRRNPNDFGYPHLDYEAAANFERDQYNGKAEYDQYGRAHGQYDLGHRRASSERPMDRIPKRRPVHRDSSPDVMDGSDLRHRLRKQRRLNGLRSNVSPDHHGEPRHRDDRHAEDGYRGRPSVRDRAVRDRDSRPVLLESSLSSRLQGRITLPVRSPPHRPMELSSERDGDRERSRGGLSTARSITHKRRPQDRIRRSPDEEFTTGRRSFGFRSNRRDDGDSVDFAGPKSLAELKGAKASGSSQEQPTKGLNAPLAAGFQASEDSITFEGPKPLSEILKRKRGSASGNDSVPSSGDESSGRNTEGLVDSASAAAAVIVDHGVSDAEKRQLQTAEEEEEDGLINIEGDFGESSVRDDTNEDGDGTAGEAAEIQVDQELENFDHEDGDYEEEAIEGENMYQDDENAYQDDEDDEDDFAKKVGVFFS